MLPVRKLICQFVFLTCFVSTASAHHDAFDCDDNNVFNCDSLGGISTIVCKNGCPDPTVQHYWAAKNEYHCGNYPTHTPTPTPTVTPTPTITPTPQNIAMNCWDLNFLATVQKLILGDIPIPDPAKAKPAVGCRMLEECLQYIGNSNLDNNDVDLNLPLLDFLGHASAEIAMNVLQEECRQADNIGLVKDFQDINSPRMDSVGDSINQRFRDGRIRTKLRDLSLEMKRRVSDWDSNRDLTTYDQDQTRFASTDFDAKAMLELTSINDHPAWFGTGFGDMLKIILDDISNLFDDFFDCMDYKIHGVCADTSWRCWKTFGICAVDLHKSYRWPMQNVQGVTEKGMSEYIPNLEIGNKNIMKAFVALGDNFRRKVDKGISATGIFGYGHNVNAVQTTVNITGLESEVINAALGANVLGLKQPTDWGQNAFQNPDVQAHANRGLDDLKNNIDNYYSDVWERVEASAINGRGDGSEETEYRVQGAWADQLLGPIFDRIPLFGACHETKNRFLRTVMPYMSEGGPFTFTSTFFRNSVAANAALDPAAAARKAALTMGCSYTRGEDKSDGFLKDSEASLYRHMTPDDRFFFPLVRTQVLNRIPQAIRKDCTRGQSQNSAFGWMGRHTETDTRMSRELSMYQGLKTVSVDPSASLLYYKYDHGDDKWENINGHKADAVQWTGVDIDFKDNQMQKEKARRYPTCYRFSPKEMSHAREGGYRLASRIKKLSREDASTDSAQVWVRATCCSYRDRGPYCAGGCPEPIYEDSCEDDEGPCK